MTGEGLERSDRIEACEGHREETTCQKGRDPGECWHIAEGSKYVEKKQSERADP